MKLVKGLLLSCVGSLCLSSAGMAHKFSGADALFAERDVSFAKATEARAAYGRMLSKGLSSDEKVYAVSQMARLDIYRGAMHPGVDIKTQKRVFEDCVDTVAQIKDTNTQQYHYYHLACVAFRGKKASALGRIGWALKLKKAQGPALASLSNGVAFEGGGI